MIESCHGHGLPREWKSRYLVGPGGQELHLRDVIHRNTLSFDWILPRPSQILQRKGVVEEEELDGK
jgi:hypothetical protein